MVVHIQAIKKLAPADLLLIEKEHAQLKRFISDLHDVCINLDNQLSCDGCDSERQASCRGQLPSFMYDILELADKHFLQEEIIMLNQPHVTEDNDYFRLHKQAHAKLMQELNQIVVECSSLRKLGKTAKSYRQLYQKISDLLEDHDRAFDDPFIQSS